MRFRSAADNIFSVANKFYVPGQDRASKVHDLFAQVAPRYDLINDLQSFWLHRWWKRKLISMAEPQPGERALDLCCGTGDVAFALAAKGARVVGLDFSESMLEVARKRSQSNPFPVDLVQGDAEALAFDDNSFDIVTISYGLRNLTDAKAGLAEMFRVAKPGGRLLVLDFGKPDNPLWRALYFSYLRYIVPVFGRLFCGDSQTHSYILVSLRNYPAQKGIAAAMQNIGCSDIRVRNLMGGIMSINYGRKK
jgi:demethylmenaquinone methyltransferase/2-methoxy-6-polyprenyl-1,4-benzoquinol methylase